MKHFATFIFVIVLVSSQPGWAYDSTSVGSIIQDSIQASTLVTEEKIEEPKEVTEENYYDYNQLFMFGFLVLGAALVVWKFRNNN
mgnify:CR=1 FL=1|jgi:hypothetical protein